MRCAALAQLVEHRFCKPTVAGSTPVGSSISGVVPEWLKGADCKSAGVSLRWFESTPHHHFFLMFAGVAQLVGRQPSKMEVESSSLFARAIKKEA